MKISEILQQVCPAFSFEFFPPKDDAGFEQLFQTIDQLKSNNPAFVSVTYGAGGSTRSKTIDLVGRIKNEIGLESMAHLTCVGHSADEIRSVLESLRDQGIDNVLALRGDPPQGETDFVRPENGFGFANELVEFIRQEFPFCIGAAGYPEGHPECPDKELGLKHLKSKVDAGSDFIVTQLFFDNRFYFDFVKQVRAMGIDVPVIPGIMPILNLKQIKRFTKMCGATFPSDLISRLESVQDDPEAVRQVGIEHATAQCEELLTEGAPGIHFYTLNRSRATLSVLERLKSLTLDDKNIRPHQKL
ncbi:MAG: methylenetetrahydrofolate reductase [NAD(P)H] [Nitrospinae bacterium]|nr:methylenetetrahydrofolate reductase [NAD(P)H] [Nitrospinota bacterium]